MCHELRSWRNAGRPQDSRRDLWQEFEETKQQREAESLGDSPPAETERAEEAVSARV